MIFSLTRVYDLFFISIKISSRQKSFMAIVVDFVLWFLQNSDLTKVGNLSSAVAEVFVEKSSALTKFYVRRSLKGKR